MKIYEIYKVAELADLSKRALDVLLALNSFVNYRTKTCFPHVKNIAQKARYSIRNTQYALAELKSKNIVTVKPRYHAIDSKKYPGLNTSNLYTIPSYEEILNVLTPAVSEDENVVICTLDVSSNAPLADPANSDNHCAQGMSKTPQLINNINLANISDSTAGSVCQTAPATSADNFTATETASIDDIVEKIATVNVQGVTAPKTDTYSDVKKPAERKNGSGVESKTAEIMDFPLARLLGQCDLPRFEQEFGAEKAAFLEMTLTELYNKPELKLAGTNIVPKPTIIRAIQHLDHSIAANAFQRYVSRETSVRDHAAYLCACLFNAVKNRANPKKSKKRRTNAVTFSPTLPTEQEIAHMEQLLARQQAQMAA